MRVFPDGPLVVLNWQRSSAATNGVTRAFDFPLDCIVLERRCSPACQLWES